MSKPAIKCRTAGVLWQQGDYQCMCKYIRCPANKICGADGRKLCKNKIKWGEYEL